MAGKSPEAPFVKGRSPTSQGPRAGRRTAFPSGSSGPWMVFALCSAGFVLSMFYRVSTAVISPALVSELRLTGPDLGTLTAAFYYAFALSQIPLGMALDRWGPRTVMTSLGVTGVLGALLFAMAHAEDMALLGRILQGVGMSCNLMGSLALIASWFPGNRFAFLSGLIAALGVLGSMAAATPLVLLSEWVGWRKAFVGIAGVNLVQILVFFAVVRDRPGGPGDRPGRKAPDLFQGMGRLLLSPVYWVIGVSAFVRYGFFVALQGLWAGLFLMQGLGYNAVAAGNALLFLNAGYGLGMPLSGRISDVWLRSRKHVVWPSLFAFAAITLSLPLWRPGIPESLVFTIFFAMGMIAATGQVIFAHIKEIVPETMTARAMTGVNFFVMCGAAVFTQILGTIVGEDPKALGHAEAFSPAWLFGAGALALVGFLYLLTPEDRVGETKGGGHGRGL